MGYRGKVREQQRARELRARGWTLARIADELGVAKSSVSAWVRDVEFVPGSRTAARRRAPNALQRRKQREIDELLEAGRVTGSWDWCTGCWVLPRPTGRSRPARMTVCQRSGVAQLAEQPTVNR